jgi:hypothetical protein
MRRDAFEVEPQNWLNVPDENLEPSNLFGLVTLLCAPALLLMATPLTSGERVRVEWGAALAGLLGTEVALAGQLYDFKQKVMTTADVLVSSGGDDGTRTHDPLPCKAGSADFGTRDK